MPGPHAEQSAVLPGSYPASPIVSVVIVTWNSGDVLLECLASLTANPPDVASEIILVDNASTDGSIARARTEFPQIRLITNTRNRGLAAANNQGIAASTAPFVLISNPDVIYSAGAIDALLELLERRRRAALAIASLRYANGKLQTSVGDLPSLTEALIGHRLSTHPRFGPRSRVWWHEWPHDVECRVGHGAEACYLVRRAAVAEIGLQDERFVLDWEGLDWSRRTRDAGWEIWFCPAATVTHLEAVSRDQVPLRAVVSSHLGMYLYFRSTTPLALTPLLGAVVLLRLVVNLMVVLVRTRVTESVGNASGPS